MKIDLKGKQVGRLTVLEHDGNTPNGQRLWRCQCSCGNTTRVVTSNLTSAKTKSCGCYRRTFRAVDMPAGQRFGRLVIVECAGRVKRIRQWLCRCDCGNEVIVRRDSLTTGKTQSCGCLLREKALASCSARRRDLVGVRFGRLVVTAPADPIYLPYLKGKRLKAYRQWQVKCDCGNTREAVRQTALVSGGVRSCGCLLIERRTENGYQMRYREYPELIPAAKALNALKKEITTHHGQEQN